VNEREDGVFSGVDFGWLVGWLVGDESVVSCGCNVEIEINMDFRKMFDWNYIFSLFVQVYVLF